jgi:hypothetical protein
LRVQHAAKMGRRRAPPDQPHDPGRRRLLTTAVFELFARSQL